VNITLDLAPIARADLPQLLEWRNDYRIWAWTRQNDLLNEVEHAEWFERQAKDPTIRMYKLVLKAGGATNMVGVCGLTSIDYRNSRAEFSLFVAPFWHRKGIGRNGLQTLFTHGFTNLGLRTIWGETFDKNPAAKMFESLGMVKEGTRRGFYWKDGNYVDAHLYSVTREEFSGRNLRPHGADPGPVVPGPSGGEPDPGDKPLRAAKGRRPKPCRVVETVDAERADGPTGPGAA